MKVQKVERKYYDKPIPVYDVINAVPNHNFIIRGSEGADYVAHNCVVFDEVNFASAGIKDVVKAKARMKEKYDTLVARVTGTFVKNGEVFGRLYVVSSKKSDSDFMEDYIASQRQAGNPHMYIFDRPQWEVWPKSKYSSDKMFKVALGGKHLTSYVIPDTQDNPESISDIKKQGYSILEVPEDNKLRFLSDLDIALRDIAGISIPGTLSFITQVSLDACIDLSRKNPFFSDVIQVGTQDTLTIEEFFHIDVIPKQLLHAHMYIHLDLSLTTDRTGISGVAVTGRKNITNDEDVQVSVPILTHVFSVALEAPKGDKIPYAKILTFICWLRRKGFNIAMISRDQYQSEYMAQLLESKGFSVKLLSLDRTPDGYITTRSVILEQRIEMLHCQLLEDELIQLQRDSVTGKVDHPAGGCFTGDTKISLVDGRELTILELLDEQKYRTNWVYTVNEDTLNIEPKPILSVHQTKLCSDLIRITLDNDEQFTCTFDHKIMLRDGHYLSASELHVGQSLMPLYRRVSKNGLAGYRLVFNLSDNIWHYEHRQFATLRPKRGQVIHHKNFNKLDNRPSNLQTMSSSMHIVLHNNRTKDYNLISKRLSEYYKRIAGTDIERARNEACRQGMIRYYKQNGGYMQDKRAARIAEIERTFGVVWSELSPSERKSYGIKFARLKDPTIQSRVSRRVSENHKSGKYKNAALAISNRIWYTNGQTNIYIKSDDSPPTGFYRGRIISEQTKERRRLACQNMSPEMKEHLKSVHSKDTANRIWITNGIEDKYISKDSAIPEGFVRGRCKIRRNHKIVSIEHIHQPCRVYDLTIQDNPNFALSAGVFVHNSKDLSDSFAGAIWNATLEAPEVPISSTKVAKAMSVVNLKSGSHKDNLPSMFPWLNRPT